MSQNHANILAMKISSFGVNSIRSGFVISHYLAELYPPLQEL